MEETLLLGKKNHRSRTLSIPAAKYQNFVNFTGAQKSIWKNFWYKVHYHKYESDYILEVWEKVYHLKKDTEIRYS